MFASHHSTHHPIPTHLSILHPIDGRRSNPIPDPAPTTQGKYYNGTHSIIIPAPIFYSSVERTLQQFTFVSYPLIIILFGRLGSNILVCNEFDINLILDLLSILIMISINVHVTSILISFFKGITTSNGQL